MEHPTKHVTLKHTDYLMMIENEILIDALKITGIENTLIYKAAQQLIENGKVDVTIKPVYIQDSTETDHE